MPDPVTQAIAPQTPLQEVDALVIKHHAEIDRIQALDSAGQQAAMRDLGVDPRAVELHYKDLIDEANELKHRDAKANRETKVAGWASFAAGGGGAIAMGGKLGSKVMRAFIVPVAALTAGFLGTYGGSRLFEGRLREESRLLNIRARNALNRELAVAIENKQRTDGINDAPAQVESVQSAAAITPRDPSFAVQAVVDKVLAANTENRRG